jgi:aminomethyltransferase
MSTSKHTTLWAEHQALGAHFTDFGGWDMPLRYSSELAEHRAVRETAGLFDLSHMGEIWVSGPDSVTFLNTALVGNFLPVTVGRAKYSLLCNAAGGILDDLIVYRLANNRFLVVPNAGNAQLIADELAARSAGFDVEVDDASSDTSLIAVQGPASVAIVQQLVAKPQQQTVADLAYYGVTTIEIAASTAPFEVLLARTGYTGEDGFELYVANEHATQLWQVVLQHGEPLGLMPAGLAARDSLRLEAGMPLYGNELRADVNPFEAGLGPIVSMKKGEQFVGREALETVKVDGPARVLVGLRGLGRRAGRAGYAVSADGRKVGVITSGQPSPTLGHPIALAYVEPAVAEAGTKVDVDVRGKTEPFEVVALPFYSRDK